MVHKVRNSMMVAAAGAAGLVAGELLLRPRFLRWGATEEEMRGPWPGDELSPRPAVLATRAVTIDAPPAAVWRWLVQIGQDRGGFYSYTWLENLAGCRMRNADRILPQHQRRAVGDTVWMTPPERYGGKGCTRVALLEPERTMVLVMPEDYDEVARGGTARQGTWALLLSRLDGGRTRLVARSRSGAEPGLAKTLFDRLFYDLAHFVMERKMLLGIKERAEREMLGARAA